MSIRRYTPEDYKELTSWYTKRNMVLVQEYHLAKIGFIVEGVAAGFLIQTDANMGILEPFIANPEASKEDRDTALDMIIEALVHTAQELGYMSVFGFGKSLPMIRRSARHGFIVIEVNSSTMFKEIR